MSKKITMSTDWHFGKSNGRFDNIILNGIIEQCNYAKDNNIKVMINLGDTLDVKQSITTSTMNYLAKAFQLINETFDKVYVLVGNHDMSKKTYNNDGHNLHIFSGYSNIEVIDTPKIISIFDSDFYFMPYFPNDYLKNHTFEKARYLCAHIEVQGFMLNQFVKAEDGLNMQAITNIYDNVFLGHFHKRQSRGNVSYIGNMCRFFYGENDEERGWTILDVENNDYEFVEYQHPKMYKFKLSTLMNLDEDLNDIFEPGDNLKLVIDKQLKYSELEEFKSKLILDYKINDLVLDDQFYAFDIDEIDDEDEIDDNVTDLDPSYMDYLLTEMGKIITDDNAIEALEYLREKSKDYQE